MTTINQGKSRIKLWGATAALTCAALLAPLLGSSKTAEAKPPAHAPAWGYRAKQGDNDYDRNRSSRNRTRYNRTRYNNTYYNTSSDRRTMSRKEKKKMKKARRVLSRSMRRNTNRTYITRYRTRYNRNGTAYREYYRVYR